MATRFDLARRLEPIRPVEDLDAGFRAEVADPAWFLARQWQLAEHQGEDAGSPVRVALVATHDAIDPYHSVSALDPRVVPAEALVESSPEEWWTPGRRIRLGLELRKELTEAQLEDPRLRFRRPAGEERSTAADSPWPRCLPAPYDGVPATALDGWALWSLRAELSLGDELFAEVPLARPPDAWDPAELVHKATFTCNSINLDLPRHDGGDIDWYSVTADDSIPAPATAPTPITLLPGRLRYPGAPHPRWWQIENARVDVGGFPPDRGHLATMLLIELVVSHADDWFSVPVGTKVGSVVTVRSFVVTDAFDLESELLPPVDWTMFKVKGLDPSSLVMWPTAVTPLRSPVIDEVVVGVDEDANLLWAVECRADGRELSSPVEPVQSHVPTGEVLATAPVQYDYRPSTRVPRFWHPYQIRDVSGRRRFVQGRLADLEARQPKPQPAPSTPLLRDAQASDGDPVHQIEPAAVPTTGLRLERRWLLARRTDGLPVLWAQRQRLPLLSPPTSGLRFDVVDERPTTR